MAEAETCKALNLASFICSQFDTGFRLRIITHTRYEDIDVSNVSDDSDSNNEN